MASGRSSFDVSPAAESPPALPDRRVHIAISGGGYRATVFGAGALLAVADSDISPNVVSISSVSGGSLASVTSIAALDDESVAAHFASLLCALARSEAIPVEAVLGQLRKEAKTVIAAVVSTMLAVLGIFVPPWLSPLPRVFFVGVTVFIVTWLVALTLMLLSESNNRLALVAEALIFGESTPETRATLAEVGWTHGGLEILSGDGIERLLCATSLATGRHVYICGDGLLVPPDPVPLPDALDLGHAVAASAAFPGFRPIRVRNNVRRHRRTMLVDGGVYDNLGAAFDLLSDELGAELRQRFQDPNILLVVDASRPPMAAPEQPLDGTLSLLRRLSIAPRRVLARVMPSRVSSLPRSASKFLASANSHARRAAIARMLRDSREFRGAIISITDVPSGAVVEFSEHEVQENSAAPTTLDALPENRVSSLLLHGYLLMCDALDQLGYLTKGNRWVPEELDTIARVEDPSRLEEAVRKYVLSSHTPAGRSARKVRYLGVAMLGLGCSASLVLIGMSLWQMIRG